MSDTWKLSVIPLEADKVFCENSLRSESFRSVCCWMLVGSLVSASAELLTGSQLTLNFLRTILIFLREFPLTAKVSSKNWQCCDMSRLSRRNLLVFINSDSNCWISFSPSKNSSYCRFSSVEMSSIRSWINMRENSAFNGFDRHDELLRIEVCWYMFFFDQWKRLLYMYVIYNFWSCVSLLL